MSHKKHPQPAERIVKILKRLYAFKGTSNRLRASHVSIEYGVSAKTISRDMQKIGKIIPLISKRGVYRIDTSKMAHFNSLPSAMFHSFASNAGLSIDCLLGAEESIPVISFAIGYNGIPK